MDPKPDERPLNLACLLPTFRLVSEPWFSSGSFEPIHESDSAWKVTVTGAGVVGGGAAREMTVPAASRRAPSTPSPRPAPSTPRPCQLGPLRYGPSVTSSPAHIPGRTSRKTLGECKPPTTMQGRARTPETDSRLGRLPPSERAAWSVRPRGLPQRAGQEASGRDRSRPDSPVSIPPVIRS